MFCGIKGMPPKVRSVVIPWQSHFFCAGPPVQFEPPSFSCVFLRLAHIRHPVLECNPAAALTAKEGHLLGRIMENQEKKIQRNVAGTDWTIIFSLAVTQRVHHETKKNEEKNNHHLALRSPDFSPSKSHDTLKQNSVPQLTSEKQT